MDYLLTNGMDKLYLGDRVELIVGPDDASFTGVLVGWDDIAVYINGLGFPVEDVLEMYPYDEV
jgi:hypothetical protein